MPPHDILQETHDAVIRIEQRLDSIDRRVGSLEHLNYGNGQPGLKADMAECKAFMQRWQKFFWALVVPALGVIVTGGFAAVVYLIRVMPHP